MGKTIMKNMEILELAVSKGNINQYKTSNVLKQLEVSLFQISGNPPPSHPAQVANQCFLFSLNESGEETNVWNLWFGISRSSTGSVLSIEISLLVENNSMSRLERLWTAASSALVLEGLIWSTRYFASILLWWSLTHLCCWCSCKDA